METIEKEKALDVVRQMVADGQVSQEVAEKYFPELKESEDIRIIKAIKYGLDHVFTNNTTVFEVTKEQCLSWLEKQGEHANFRNKIQIGDKVTRNEDGVLVNLSQLKRIAKPTEEYNITGIGSKNAQGKLGEMIKNLKPVNEVLEQGFAWSEEDEKQARQIERIVHDDGCTQKLQKQIANWLKSLKDRYTWKPSAEQMKFLWKYAEQNNYDGSILTSLYNDLKKLRQE